MGRPLREQARSHTGSAVITKCDQHRSTVGAGLLAKRPAKTPSNFQPHHRINNLPPVWSSFSRSANGGCVHLSDNLPLLAPLNRLRVFNGCRIQSQPLNPSSHTTRTRD
ncbi:hypothetical protein C5612_25660 [Pseudomonas frederiksbergensis]|uniref:Uncharacterized protein n=1 Tax=Pseudomonas frederiksbergensis TaxID=104087 RepID=A0A2S8HAX0_9PSED|nr:hypothetical protein C5612_25660 [Pseudomonas frederiksbergensis]